MIRQNIILGNYTYILDLYKHNIDMKDEVHTNNYAIMRKYDVVNGIAYDTDIYFIEKSILDKCIVLDENGNATDNFDLNLLKDEIVYPIPNNNYSGYSSNFYEFNDNYIETLFGYNNDVYKIFGNDLQNFANIPCDKLRIYFPIVNSNLNAILHISNYINDIHFHYLCRFTNKYKIQSETEFIVNNNRYSEFIEVYIPNIEDLLSTNKYFILNDIVTNEYSYKFNVNDVDVNVNLVPIESETGINITTDIEIVSKNTDSISFDINANDTTYKCYTVYESISISKTIGININNIYKYLYGIIKDTLNSYDMSFNLYIDIDDYTNIYIIKISIVYCINESSIDINDILNLNYFELFYNKLMQYNYTEIHKYNEISYLRKYKYSITLTNNDTIYISILDKLFNIEVPVSYNNNAQYNSLSSLIVPFMINKSSDNAKKIFVNINKSVENRYLNEPIIISLFPVSYLNNNTGLYIIDDKYDANCDEFVNNIFFKLSSKLGFDNGIISILNTFIFPTQIYDNIKDAYYKYNNVTQLDYITWKPEDIYEDEELSIDTNLSVCGYHIEIASDVNFTQVFYKLDINTSNKENVIYDFAFQLNNIFTSWDNMPELIVVRTMFIDKLLNYTIIGNDVVITKEWYKYFINDTEEYRISNISELTADPNEKNSSDITNMNLTYFNFIDKINCSVVKTEQQKEISNISNNPKILYKPVFYKVNELQNIKIKNGLTQNIGINLVDYMSKVDTFKLLIDGLEYVEYARNDIYVIFNIQAVKLTSTAGVYAIVNQDDELISDGKWSIY